MSHRRTVVLVVLASALMLAVSVAQADVFNMPTGQTSLSLVTVGDPGNVLNPVMLGSTTGYGSVDYTYQMGEYDVTVGQYCQFLNAVAKTDTYGLYNSYMAPAPGFPLNTGSMPTVGITQSGISGSYSYSVTGSDPQAVNCPIFCESWGDAARFCNWLQNGQPTGAEGPGTTEAGAYTLNGDTTNLLTETRNARATYFIPSENEWYKAAYYDPSNLSYWLYPTKSNTLPGNTLPETGNNANCATGSYPNYTYTDPTNYLTPVGAFAGSPGPYGTYDMGGDVEQWNEAIIDGYRVMLGGCWDSPPDILASWPFSATTVRSTLPYPAVGFRVASVPWGWRDPGDANNDGTVDINDLTIVLANFGTTYGVGIAAVPEPSSFLLIDLGVVSLVVCTCRRRR